MWGVSQAKIPTLGQFLQSEIAKIQNFWFCTIYLGYIVGPCPYHGDPQVRTKRDLVIGKYIMFVFNEMLLTLSDAKSVNKFGEMSTSILGTALVDI